MLRDTHTQSWLCNGPHFYSHRELRLPINITVYRVLWNMANITSDSKKPISTFAHSFESDDQICINVNPRYENNRYNKHMIFFKNS